MERGLNLRWTFNHLMKIDKTRVLVLLWLYITSIVLLNLLRNLGILCISLGFDKTFKKKLI